MTDLIVRDNNLPQLELEIKFYLGQTAQNIIEVGKRLIQAKSLVQHGLWQLWLNDNFQLSYRTAKNFMQCAERFQNVKSIADLNSTQMIALLSLPDAAETEKFIAEKAADEVRSSHPIAGVTNRDGCTFAQVRFEFCGHVHLPLILSIS